MSGPETSPGDRVRVTITFTPTVPEQHYLGTVTRILPRPMWPSGRDVEVTLDHPEQWRKDSRCWPAWAGPTVFTRDQIEVL